MATPIVLLIDVLAADATPSDAELRATIRSGGDGTGALSVFDLSASRGDGVFETLGVVNGAAQSIDAHVERLASSAAALDLPAPNAAQWREAISRIVALLPATGQSSIKLVLSRGVDGSGVPTAWIAGIGSSGFPERETGVRVVLLDRGYASDVQERSPWLLAGAKTLSYAVNMAAIREAKRRGADDVLFVSSDGYVLEGPTSTVVARIDGVYVTPPASSGILPGTTQLALFEHLSESGSTVDYRMLRPEDLASADGIWLLSSVRLAAPVSEIDGAPVPIDHQATTAINDALLARTD
ncbi:aminodeoxychorismate lyase [Plantibacter sp. Mn2098]|uniref:aminodeoxychorismate lyase n=1 Tax=Plantibacter sp. Mn2098 TaxID=3395266 RepID=UPI003BE5BB8B